MKLLKYVMTSDTGLAPNPYFGICSLAVCTPNHRKAKLEIGDWIVGHSSKATGNKLIHAMCVTKILTMSEYFQAFPQKRPDPEGDQIAQCGDNFYSIDAGKWRRLPSACHNDISSFNSDQDKPVFLAEGEDDFWYFGGTDDPTSSGFSNMFPELIKDRQGISYVRDRGIIDRFTKWLSEYGRSGLIGQPRDAIASRPDQFLLEIDPAPKWISIGNETKGVASAQKTSSCRVGIPRSSVGNQITGHQRRCT